MLTAEWRKAIEGYLAHERAGNARSSTRTPLWSSAWRNYSNTGRQNLDVTHFDR